MEWTLGQTEVKRIPKIPHEQIYRTQAFCRGTLLSSTPNKMTSMYKKGMNGDKTNTSEAHLSFQEDSDPFPNSDNIFKHGHKWGYSQDTSADKFNQ